MDDSISALSALYQGEKTDASAIFNVAMTMMGIAAAYVVAAISLADKYGTTSLPWTAVLLLPAPLWIVVAFHSLIALNAMSHGVSVRILEDALVLASRPHVSWSVRDIVGSKSADRIMDFHQSKPIHKITTVFVYGGVGAGVIGYTIFVISRGWDNVPPDVRIAAITGYAVAALIVVGSWTIGLRRVREAASGIPKCAGDEAPASASPTSVPQS